LVSKFASRAEQCPQAEEIFPCKCASPQSDGLQIPSIKCTGPEIKDLKQILSSKLKSGTGAIRQFSALYIEETSVTEIEAGTFGDASFEAIFIKNNNHLKLIDANSFRPAHINSNHLSVLDIKNNTNLVSNSDIFQLVNNLQVRDKIEFSNLGITEIPDKAFSVNSNLKYVFIQYNPNLTRIGKSAFTSLSNLGQLFLQNNSISTIDDSGLGFQTVNNLTVLLMENKITDKGLSNNLFGNNTSKPPHELILNNNKITKLMPQIFRHKFDNNKIQTLVLSGNPLICDCDAKWVLDDKMAQFIHNFRCTDKLNESIYTLDKKDFGKCS
jgi:hypothetical protein